MAQPRLGSVSGSTAVSGDHSGGYPDEAPPVANGRGPESADAEGLGPERPDADGLDAGGLDADGLDADGLDADGLDAAVARRLSTFADLTHVVAWELEVPGAGLFWHAPFSRLIKDPGEGSFRIPPGSDGRLVAGADLGDALLAPIVETVKSGVVWENDELV